MNNTPCSTLLTSYTYIDLIGDDCDKFLQGQITIDVGSLKEDQAKLAAICNPKGRIVSLFHIHRINNGVRCLLPAEICQATLSHLSKYLVFYKTTIEAAEVNVKIIASKYPAKSEQQSIAIAGTDYTIGYTSEASVDQQSNPDTPYDDINAWYWHLVERKIPWLAHETIEKFLPHNLDLPRIGAIDFNKGCFTGQEVIARMQYKGNLKQHLQQLQASTGIDFVPGQSIFRSEKKIGEIICGVNQDSLGCFILAVIKDSELEHHFFQLESENSSILELI